MSNKHSTRIAFTLILTLTLIVALVGCTISQASTPENEMSLNDGSTIYGEWESSSTLVEEQLMRGSGTDSSGVSAEGVEATQDRARSHFRDTENGEPLSIHQFVNQVLIDDEYVKITLQSKTADELGDAGFTLVVENRYEPLTAVGHDNYCYLTPVMGTWTVNGVPMDPKAEGKVYPAGSGMIYLYFDELSTIEELVDIQGTFEIYLISDWWNPVGVYEFKQP